VETNLNRLGEGGSDRKRGTASVPHAACVGRQCCQFGAEREVDAARGKLVRRLAATRGHQLESQLRCDILHSRGAGIEENSSSGSPTAESSL
jgi:hypothetical protein